jgi:LPS-assembly lipoprotein
MWLHNYWRRVRQPERSEGKPHKSRAFCAALLTVAWSACVYISGRSDAPSNKRWTFSGSIELCRWLLCCLALSLAACGFTLRGARELPPGMAQTYIQGGTSGSALVGYLKRFLRDSSVQVTEYPATDIAVLKVRESSTRRVLSVGNDAKAREYEVEYRATFSVAIPGMEQEFPEKTITLSRDYIFDRLAVLAVNEEEAMLVRDMQRELARMIVEQIAAYPWQPASTVTPE